MSVLVMVEGQRYSDWKSVSVSRSLGDGARSFTIAAVNIPNPLWPLDEAPMITIYLDGVLVLTGSIENDQAKLGPDTHSRQLAGRSITGDLIDSSVIVPGNEMKGRTLEQAMNQAAKGFASKVKIKGVPGVVFDPPIRPFQGETVFGLADRLARLRGAIPTDDAAGNLVLFRQEFGPPVAELIEGHNIKELSRTRKTDQRHSEYVVKGQKPGTDLAFGEETSVEARLADPFVKRHRPKVIVMEEPGDKQAARERADWEAASSAKDALQVSGTVQGWLRAAGALWEPGDLVQVISPSLELDRTLQVESAVSTLDDNGGHVTQLTFTVPESATPEPAAGAKQTGAKPAGVKSSSSTAAKPGKTFTASDIWSETKPNRRAE